MLDIQNMMVKDRSLGKQKDDFGGFSGKKCAAFPHLIALSKSRDFF
jgi:hypothetical protein